MKVNSFEVVGPISEHADFLHRPMRDNEVIEVNLAKMTFINSVGVKNWISWTARVPASDVVKLIACPFVIISQARIVQGFLPKNFFVESFYAPYVCDNCNAEKNLFFERGKNFQYTDGATPASSQIPAEIPCEKCSNKMEPDFVVAQTMTFLK